MVNRTINPAGKSNRPRKIWSMMYLMPIFLIIIGTEIRNYVLEPPNQFHNPYHSVFHSLSDDLLVQMFIFALFTAIFSIIGGLIMYAVLRKKNSRMARRGFFLGLILAVCYVNISTLLVFIVPEMFTPFD